ncbi:hypothetical protein LUW77_25075 [Streptomyces radiopugnans]|nr:hypothetical protein LUW77_25075 [Streptomyces radiopugnans]
MTRAIGAAAPSLAVASTMHHFSVATIFTLAESLRSSGVEWALLEGIATQNLLVSSGFAEGNPGQGILSPTVSGVRVDGGIVVNGSKLPCSMSRSMDLLSASIAVPREDGGQETVLMLLLKGDPGGVRPPLLEERCPRGRGERRGTAHRRVRRRTSAGADGDR